MANPSFQSEQEKSYKMWKVEATTSNSYKKAKNPNKEVKLKSKKVVRRSETSSSNWGKDQEGESMGTEKKIHVCKRRQMKW